MKNKTFYVTTPIYYPSAKAHIGHALTTTMADTLTRHKKLAGYDTWFLTGTDEHGQKIEKIANEKGISPQEHVDKIVPMFQDLWKSLNIEYSDFIRTTEPRHKIAVQKIFMKIFEKGDIYKGVYRDYYCTPCETFWKEKDLLEGNACPDCSGKTEIVEEECYFLRMSKYEKLLIDYINGHAEFIQPESRKNEMLNFIGQGLEDLCVSRSSFTWGIPVPVETGHIIYVWLDALTNYISALGYGTEKDELYQKFWGESTVHLVGKDIIRFHTIIWPIILMAADLPLPKTIFGHGWVLLNSGKMSKSKGNVVDPKALIEIYGSDAIRYFLLREMTYGQDVNFSQDALTLRSNTDLSNDYGNLLSRTTAMINKYFDGIIPFPKDLDEGMELQAMCSKLPENVNKYMDKFDFATALAEIWKVINKGNKYIEDSAPWALAKDVTQMDRLATVLYNLAESIRICTLLIGSFMPDTPNKVWKQLGVEEQARSWSWEDLAWGKLPSGVKINRGEPLFPRIELAESAERIEKKAEKQAKKEQKHAEKIDKSLSTENLAADNATGTNLISIDEVTKLELRVAEIITVEKIEKADKLLKLQIKIGTEERTLVAGIALQYLPKELIGKKIVVVYNLKPAKLRGIMSYGMLLAASIDDQMSLITVDRDIPSGAKVK